jgi:hypothetical protein
MSYNPNIPQSNSIPNVIYAGVQQNFASFNSNFSTSSAGVVYNHVPLNSFNQGKHAAVLFQLQTSDPGVTGDYDVLYCKNATLASGASPQLFIQIPRFLPNQFDPATASNTPMQLTYNSVNTSGPIFQSFLPGGYVFFFGSVSIIVSPGTFPYTITLPGTLTKMLLALANPNNLTSSGTPTPFTVSTNIINANNFNIYSNATGTVTFTWMAIVTQ